jgi:endonuclease I
VPYMPARLFIFFFLLLLKFAVSNAQIPEGYYFKAESLQAEPLRKVLCEIISKDAKKIPYGSGRLSGIWGSFQYTDVFPFPHHQRIWDMYSDNPDGEAAYYFVLGTQQCGTAHGEGDCYSREHSFPKSYWGGKGQTGSSDPQYTDLFHLIPADQYVNGRRNNNPYGVVDHPVWTSTNGSKLGPNSYNSLYLGTVFEPIDEYKGDIARSYLYIATRYMNQFSAWEKLSKEGDVIIDGNTYTSWFLNMLLEWNALDSVSQKEIDRNNAVFYFTGQGNRNPFIDYPEYIEKIWKTTTYSDQKKHPILVYSDKKTLVLKHDDNGLWHSYKVVDMMGVILKKGAITDSKIAIVDIPKGCYLLVLQSEESIKKIPFYLH